MKHSFNFPQKKGKIYICHSIEKIWIELHEIKIKNFSQLSDNKGYFFDCIIPNKLNKKSIDEIKNIDEQAKEVLLENYNNWFETEDNSEEFINDNYNNSYNDNSQMTLILSNNIDCSISINEEIIEIEELLSFLNNNKSKNKNHLISLDIIFLGIYINNKNGSIINKWAIKRFNIETTNEIDFDIKRDEIEEEWQYELIKFEEEINNNINELKRRINNAKSLYNEIINENSNLNIWENKLDKLKMIIFRK